MLYRLYNHVVDSNLALDKFGIIPLKEKTPNKITLEFLPHCIDKEGTSNYENHQTHSTESYGYYFVDNIAIFEIFSGNKILIKYFNDIDDDLIHTLLNYPFAILFNQRQKYVLHASSVVYEDKVFCFCGKSLAGKSSIAAHLLNNGGLLVSEDTCVFDEVNDELVILPSYNFIKLSDEVGKYTDIISSKPIRFTKKLTDRKGYVLESERFTSKPRPVDYFIYLRWAEGHPRLKQLDNESSLKNILQNEFISYSKESSVINFKAASTLINKAKHYLYSREKKLRTLDEFLDIVIKKML